MPTEDGKRLREKVVEGAEKIEENLMSEEDWEVVRSQLYLARRRQEGCSRLSVVDHAHRPRSVPGA